MIWCYCLFLVNPNTKKMFFITSPYMLFERGNKLLQIKTCKARKLEIHSDSYF